MSFCQVLLLALLCVTNTDWSVTICYGLSLFVATASNAFVSSLVHVRLISFTATVPHGR